MRNILVVDDDYTIRMLIRKFLTRNGYEVFEADHAQKGIDILKTQIIHMVLTDVMMPGEGGFSFIESVKADKSLAKIPMVVISSLPEEQLRQEAFKIGGVDYLTKPIDFDQLGSMIFLNFSDVHTTPNPDLDDVELMRKKQAVVNRVAASMKVKNHLLVGNVLCNALVETMGAQNVSFWLQDDKAEPPLLTKAAHSGMYGYEMPVNQIYVEIASPLHTVLLTKKASLVNNAFRSPKVISPSWTRDVGLISEAIFPVFTFEEKFVFNVKEVNYDLMPLLGLVIIHSNSLMTEKQFQITERLIRQVSSLLSYAYHENKKSTGNRY